MKKIAIFTGFYTAFQNKIIKLATFRRRRFLGSLLVAAQCYSPTRTVAIWCYRCSLVDLLEEFGKKNPLNNLPVFTLFMSFVEFLKLSKDFFQKKIVKKNRESFETFKNIIT